MIALDILLLAVVGTAVVIGYSRGILSQIGSIAAIVAGVVIARLLGSTVASWVGDGQSALDSVAGYGIAFVAAYAGVWYMSRMLRSAVRTAHLGVFDRVAGAAFKVFKWGLALSLVLNVYLLVSDNDERLHDPGAPWRKAAIDFAPAVLGYISDMKSADNATADDADVENPTATSDVNS